MRPGREPIEAEALTDEGIDYAIRIVTWLNRDVPRGKMAPAATRWLCALVDEKAYRWGRPKLPLAYVYVETKGLRVRCERTNGRGGRCAGGIAMRMGIECERHRAEHAL